MVLKVDGQMVATFTSLDAVSTSQIARASQDFAARPVRTVVPMERYLYVGQREMAAVSKMDPSLDILGSEDATTCHIVILRANQSQNCGIIHIDSEEGNQLESLVDALEHLETEGSQNSKLEEIYFDLYVIGGFNDNRGLSAKISESLIKYTIQDVRITFNLKLFCSGQDNTFIDQDGVVWPRHYGAAVSIRSGDVFPAKFSDHGPDKDIRMLRMHSEASDEILNIYPAKSGHIVLPPFFYTSHRTAHQLTKVTDQYLLKNFSTSPDVEPPHFCQDMRNIFRRMVTDPDPLKSVFKGGRSRVYSRCQRTGAWLLMDADKYEDEGAPSPIEDKLTVKDFVKSVKKL